MSSNISSSSLFSSHPHLTTWSMEDFKNQAAGCAVLSCCCPCLLLQLGVFILFRLPQRLAVKVKKLVVARKIKKRKVEKNEGMEEEEIDVDGGGEVAVVKVEGDEEVWEVLLGHGVFWFGSFWGEGGSMENVEEIQLCRLEAIGAIVGWARSLEEGEGCYEKR
ncbi:uncharacterized protein LOC110024102 [Phalaenopsis equestris]|uniref:uncharacterized protein LOC110024102 n=1 Tax=Phalaenopsis equestris TaxID=78828 RepID=UPI0009E3E1A4|nr:uncharacterized protein LOC110024102 [Phalaenopsis equestris]